MISWFIKMDGFGYTIRFSFVERSNLKNSNTYFYNHEKLGKKKIKKNGFYTCYI